MIKLIIIITISWITLTSAQSEAGFQVSTLGIGIRTHHPIAESLDFEASLQANPFILDVLPNQKTNQNQSLSITKKTLLQSLKLGIIQTISEPFSLSTGLLINNNKENLTGRLISPITFNNTTINPDTAGKLTGEITYPSIGAYLSTVMNYSLTELNSNLVAEFGIAYQGKPSISISGDGTLSTIQTQQELMQASINNSEWFPIISISMVTKL